ncbi:MAG: DUF6503 family protein [Algoriphagus sp.]|uniref:DUF6503 family protein n=1 Tax=Algoriphagus sp. TaxID=1872435 RepID=UPI00262BFE13|nr:DUF6503 family protein [Algoriphagus sp.]MDG1276113.1 DUF6503 family protein [Algoriphagus sp.]
MNKIYLLFIAAVISSCSTPSDQLSGPELIQKSIEFHDPNQSWPKLKATFEFTDSLPAPRESRSYSVSFENNLSKMVYRNPTLNYIVWNDSVQVFEGEIENEQAIRMRNYYTYLWGLPMKLNDPATQIDQEVNREELNGKSYLVARVPYEKDIWYFYIDPNSYRLEAYKFYQDEPNQKGEIIYLEGVKEFKGLKIPANRTWYRTETPEFLGTDKLIEIKE